MEHVEELKEVCLSCGDSHSYKSGYPIRASERIRGLQAILSGDEHPWICRCLVATSFAIAKHKFGDVDMIHCLERKICAT